MMAGIVARFFPPISDRLYDLAPGLDVAVQPAARAILALAHRRLTFWQRLVPLRLAGSGPVAALMRLHRLAFEAERAGARDRADFYWREFDRLLPDVWADGDAWQSVQEDAANTAG